MTLHDAIRRRRVGLNQWQVREYVAQSNAYCYTSILSFWRSWRVVCRRRRWLKMSNDYRNWR